VGHPERQIMSKYLKGLLQGELERRFAEVSDFVVVDYKGITGNENNEMRGALKEKGIALSVVKNSAMRRALATLGHETAAGLFLSGPCAVAYGGDSVVDVAREISDWAKKVPAVSLKAAYVDGEALDAAAAQVLAKMPSRAELQGQVVQLALSPGARLAGAITGPGARIAGCLKSLIETLEKEAA